MSLKISLVVIILLLSACASYKTEQEQYDEMQDSFTYMTYKAVSKNTINPSLYLYNEMLRKDHYPDVRPEVVHSLYSVLLSLGQEPKYAAAEANIALESSVDQYGRFLSNTALSVALHSNGWEGLGEKYSARAHVQKTSKGFNNYYEDSIVVVNLILGVSAITEGDGESAESLFYELGDKTGQEWLPIVAHGAAIIFDMPSFDTISKLKTLAGRDTLSISQKEKLAELQLLAEEYGEEPEKLKIKTNELVKKWSLASLHLLAESAAEATIDATLKVLEAITMLQAHS